MLRIDDTSASEAVELLYPTNVYMVRFIDSFHEPRR